jgi:sec-independent protein translocase protein TatA
MGLGELILILVIVVVVFGATKLPDLADGLGEAIKRSRGRTQGIEPPHLLLQRTSRRRWTVSDWLLLGAAVVLATVVITNALLRVIGTR